MKDFHTEAIILQEATKDTIYKWSYSLPSTQSIIVFSFLKVLVDQWHQHLGHPLFSILSHLVSTKTLPMLAFYLSKFLCNSFHCNKTHKLPFSSLSFSSSYPLELLYSDIWTSLVTSIDEYKYYVIFVYHYSHYIWLYNLKKKYDVHDIFIRFKALAKKFFQKFYCYALH